MRRRQNQLICRIDTSAFSAILWVLSYIYLCAVPSIHSRNHTWVNVKHSIAQPNALREDALHIAVVRDSRIFFGSVYVLPEQLPDKIKDGIRQRAERKIYIYADGRAPYSVVCQVLDAARQANIENVAFITELRDNF